MISRRDFLKKLGIGAGGAVVATTLPAPVQPEMPTVQAVAPVLPTSMITTTIYPTNFMVMGTAVMPRVTSDVHAAFYAPATREDI